MKNVSIILIIVVSCLITSCSKFPDVGNGYKLDYNGRGDVFLVKCLKEGDAPTVFIHGHILDIAFDSTFVVVAERPRDSVDECTEKMPGMTSTQCEEAFQKSTFRQYWILNKKGNPEFNEKTLQHENVYGPYTQEEYLKKREELGVPKGLQLKPLKH